MRKIILFLALFVIAAIFFWQAVQPKTKVLGCTWTRVANSTQPQDCTP